MRIAANQDAKLKDAEGRTQGKLLGLEANVDEFKRIEEAVESVDKGFMLFQQMQDEFGMNAAAFREQKRVLSERLQTLRVQLDRFLATDYDKKNLRSETVFEKWRESHQPFHWFVEFFGILDGGGFDVIIGNPPYVELSDIIGRYSIQQLSLVQTGNLYSLCLERFTQLLHRTARLGAIVPISSISTPRMLPLMQLLQRHFYPLHLSNFAVRPGKLFVGVDMNLTIIVGKRLSKTRGDALFSSAINRWNERARPTLFPNLSFAPTELIESGLALAKTGSDRSADLLNKISQYPSLARHRSESPGADKVYYHSGGRYFRKCIREQLSNEYKPLNLGERICRCRNMPAFVVALLLVLDRVFGLLPRDEGGYRRNARSRLLCVASAEMSRSLATRLLEDLWKHAERRTRNRMDGTQQEEVNFHVGMSKPIIDEIDSALAKHYGLSPDELDFIANYDAKYRFADNGEPEMSNRFLQNGRQRGLEFNRDIVAAIKNARSVDIAVSYLQMSGWFMLWRDLERIPPARIRIITTDQMNITQPAVLKAALHLGVQIKCYCGSRVFHPKVYIFHGIRKSKNLAILGSANISASGLEKGIEAGIRTSDPLLFKRLTRWFENLFLDPTARDIDERFVADYEKRWKLAAQARVQLRRIPTGRAKSTVAPTPEDADTLDDVFSTIVLPVGTLGFDHAGNNIRNLARLLDVLARYPKISYKEKSELHLLGFMHDGKLTSLGMEAKRCRTTAAAAKLWCSWVKRTPDVALSALNTHLTSFKRAANRFWRLKRAVRSYFLHEMANAAERETLQAIELCCNGSTVVESLSVSDFKTMAPFMLSGKGLSEFIKRAVADYLDNKGGRSWTGDDRRIVLNAWRGRR